MCIELYYITWQLWDYVVLNCIILHYAMLHYIILHCVIIYLHFSVHILHLLLCGVELKIKNRQGACKFPNKIFRFSWICRDGSILGNLRGGVQKVFELFQRTIFPQPVRTRLAGTILFHSDFIYKWHSFGYCISIPVYDQELKGSHRETAIQLLSFLKNVFSIFSYLIGNFFN